MHFPRTISVLPIKRLPSPCLPPCDLTHPQDPFEETDFQQKLEQEETPGEVGLETLRLHTHSSNLDDPPRPPWPPTTKRRAASGTEAPGRARRANLQAGPVVRHAPTLRAGFRRASLPGWLNLVPALCQVCTPLAFTEPQVASRRLHEAFETLGRRISRAHGPFPPALPPPRLTPCASPQCRRTASSLHGPVLPHPASFAQCKCRLTRARPLPPAPGSPGPCTQHPPPIRLLNTWSLATAGVASRAFPCAVLPAGCEGDVSAQGFHGL